ncbi:acyloxyacyl hydrolase [Phenylobacterium sp.]|jgi:hypothetical protein|uniref:acyloxyacyl hydrolase n=1 Tax=Phenylobacterium sp. TaxID=1871053 RepID=UPI002F93AB21
MRAAAWAIAAVLALPAPAVAGEVFLGAYAHDIDDEISIGHTAESGAQVIGGFRTERIDALSFIGRPQAHVMGAVNTAGGINYAAAGVSWRFGDTLYVRPGIGVAVHSGEVDLPSPFEPGITVAEQKLRLQRNDLDLGSRVLAQLELAVGWQATERLGIELSWLHLSHGQLFGEQNPGLGEVGVRAIYRFGP